MLDSSAFSCWKSSRSDEKTLITVRTPQIEKQEVEDKHLLIT